MATPHVSRIPRLRKFSSVLRNRESRARSRVPVSVAQVVSVLRKYKAVVTEGMGKPRVHLWLYNAPFNGISDQVGFVIAILRQNGYPASIGRRPCLSSLNVVIENFGPETRDELVKFCKSSGKKVAVIMTEHLDYVQGQIILHGIPVGSRNDYMDPNIMLKRVRSLLECVPYIRSLFVLGDLPQLRNISIMLPNVDVRSIPFPSIGLKGIREPGQANEAVHDLVFAGALTSYRKEVLGRFNGRDPSVVFSPTFVSRRRRNIMNTTAKVILNIPQRPGWRWLSSMRIIAGLHTGRPTISLGTNDVSQIASCCTQLDLNEREWLSEVRQLVADWKSLYLRDINNYLIMAKAFEQDHPFPHDLFEFWSITDRVRCS